MTAQPKKRLPFLVIVLIALFAFCVFCSIASLAMDKMGLLPTSTPAIRLVESTQVENATTQVVPTKPLKEPRCVPASPAQIEYIQTGIKDIDQNNDVTSNIWAVHSNDFENIWFVAAEIQGSGIQPKEAIGVWAISGDPASPGIILSVDGFAKNFSIYPDGSTTDAQTAMSDDGAQEALACATNN
jgi:hypothetical protein